MRMRLLRAKNELQQVKTQELMKLLKGSGLDLSGREADSIKSQLVQQGHLTREGLVQGPGGPKGTSQSLVGSTLSVTEAPDSLNLPSTSEQPATVTVVSSQGNTATLQYRGETFSVNTPEPLDPGTQLQVTARRTDGGQTLQVESVSRRQLSSSQLNDVLKTLDLGANERNRSRLSRVVLENTNRSPSDVLKAVRAEFQLESVPKPEETRESLKRLLNQYKSSGSKTGTTTQSLSNLSPEGLNQLLKEFGIEPSQSARETLRTILRTDPQPSKDVAKTIMDNLGLARNQDGMIDQQRLKTVLFLAKNDLPVKQELVDLLQYAAPDSGNDAKRDINALKQTLLGVSTGAEGSSESSESLKQTLANLSLPEFRPTGGEEGSKDLLRVLKQLGFDLERQVVNQPEQASDSLRSQLTQLQQTLSEVAAEKIQQFVESGNSELQNESRRVLSQLFKFSMSSVAEDDSIFLFVPFPDGDETGLMRMRFQDESDGESLDDEQWSVTINLELSQLGPIRVGAQRHKEQLNLDFRARDKASLNLIRDRSEELSEILTDRGFDVSVRTGVLREEQDSLIDWNLYFDSDHYTGTLDVTI